MKHTHILSGAVAALLCATTPVAFASISVSGDGSVDVGGAMPMQIKGDDVSLTQEGQTIRAKGTGEVEMRMEDGSTIRAEGDDRGGAVELRGAAEHATGTARAMEVADEHALDMLELHLDMSDDSVVEDVSLETPSFDEVRTEADLRGFIRQTSKEDARLKSVDIKEGKVEVEYDQDAKLFGFIKTTLRTHTSVDTSENVEVSYPWYHIFMKKEQSKATLQSEIARALAAERKMTAEGTSTTSAEATISAGVGIADIFDIITRTLRGSASASVE